jgi:hypothetical protein
MMTDDPASLATIAAGNPQAPEPITTTSTSWSQRVGAGWAWAETCEEPAAMAAAATPPRTSRSRRLTVMDVLPPRRMFVVGVIITGDGWLSNRHWQVRNFLGMESTSVASSLASSIKFITHLAL